jgi:hypothetical protein
MSEEDSDVDEHNERIFICKSPLYRSDEVSICTLFFVLQLIHLLSSFEFLS